MLRTKTNSWAVDVYVNYTKMGFDLKRSGGGEYGHLWTCTMEAAGCTYMVYTFGKSVSTVNSVKGVAQGVLTAEALEFISYVATVSYEGGNPAKAKQWVKDNIKKGGEMTIGRVKFSLHAPTDFARMLILEGI